jgi:hypothetical protein
MTWMLPHTTSVRWSHIEFGMTSTLSQALMVTTMTLSQAWTTIGQQWI